MIDKTIHRTASSLLLIHGDDDCARVMRASKDLYPDDTNFSCLPDMPANDLDNKYKKTLFTKLDKLNEISRNMKHDEQIQVQLF